MSFGPSTVTFKNASMVRSSSWRTPTQLILLAQDAVDIPFTKRPGDGRYGFLPVKTRADDSQVLGLEAKAQS